MAGPKRPSRKRPASFSPKPKSTQPRTPVRPPVPPPAAPARRTARPAVPPRRVEDEPEPDLVAEAKKGSSGRSIGQSQSLELPAAPEPEVKLPPGVSPFAQYSGGVAMAGHLERGRADTVRVVAIMVGLLFVVGSALVLSGAVVFAGLAWTGKLDEVAGNGEGGDGDPTHIRDTGVIKPGVIEARERRRPAGGSTPTDAEEPAPEAPKPQPVVVNIQQGVFFHEVEVSCPDGFRGRARVSNNRATIQSVSPGQECRVTFKGGQPAQTNIYAGQTIACTFAPTNCVVTAR